MPSPTGPGDDRTGPHELPPEGSRNPNATPALRDTAPPDETPADSPSSRATPPTPPGYEILELLGRGGMGVVYKARQLRPSRTVALKMILSEAPPRERELARFRAEAEAVAALQHPNVVQIYEVGETDGRPYFSLEYVDGGSLARKLRGEPQPFRDAAELTETLARAMDAVHTRGVLHRDLKPANILLTADGLAKIADFGLAKLATSGDGQTRTGDVMGTPGYMAPEQAGGVTKLMGPPVDVYALGAILYELLTGRPPFKSETPIEAVLQVLYEEPVPPRRLRPGVPRDLETICLKCLEKRPERRYAAAADLADDLRRFLDNRPIKARPIGALGRARKWAARNKAITALLAVTVVAAGVVFGVVLKSSYDRGVLIGDLKKANDDLEAANVATKRESDQKEVERANAVAARREAQDRLQSQYLGDGLRLLDEGDPLAALVPLTEAELLYRRDPDSLGPEGRARAELNRVRLSLVAGQCPRLLNVWTDPAGMVFTPSARGDVLLGSPDMGRRYVLRDLRTGGLRASPVRIDASGFSSPHPTTDGRFLILERFAEGVRLWDARTGDRVAGPFPVEMVPVKTDPDPATVGVGFELPKFAPKGRVEVSADGTRLLTSWKGNTVRLWNLATGEPVGPDLDHPTPPTQVGFSAGGRWAWTRAADGVRTWEASGGKSLGPVIPPPNGQFGLQKHVYSPDGSRCATFQGLGDAFYDTATARSLAPLGIAAAGPVSLAWFRPDGFLLYAVGADHTIRAWNAITGQLLPVVMAHPSPLVATLPSPDGRVIATICADQTLRLWDGNTSQPLCSPVRTGHPAASLAFGPDGRRVMTTAADGTARVWHAFTGRPLTPPLGGGGGVPFTAFTPDGLGVVIRGADAVTRVWGSLTPDLLPLAHGGEVRSVEFSAAGDRLATGGAAPTGGAIRVWDARTGQSPGVLARSTGIISAARFSPDGKRILSEETSGVYIVNAETGQMMGKPAATAPGATLRTAFAPAGDRFLTADTSGHIRVWDALTGAPGLVIKHREWMANACFNEDGTRVITCGVSLSTMESEVRIRDVATGEQVGAAIAAGHTSTLEVAAGRLLTANVTKIQVWDVATGKLVSEMTHPTDSTPAPGYGAPGASEAVRRPGGVSSAAISRNGRVVATGDTRGVLRVWDAGTGRLVASAAGHYGAVRAVTLSPDGRFVLTGGDDGAARLWDAAAGAQLAGPLRHAGPVTSVAFSKDATRAATGSSDGTAHLWQLRADAPEAALDLVRLSGKSAGSPPDAVAAFAAARAAHPDRFAVPPDVERGSRERELAEAFAADHPAPILVHADRLAELGPLAAELKQRRAEARLVAGRWEEALNDFTELLAVPGMASPARYGRGAAHTLLGRYKEAKEDFAAAVRTASPAQTWHLVNALCMKGLLHARDGEHEEYQKAWEELLQSMATRPLDPPQTNSFVRLRTLAPVRPGVNYDPTVQFAESHVETTGRDYNAVLALGGVLYRTGRHERAVAELVKAVNDWEARSRQPRGRPGSLPPPTVLDAAEAVLFTAVAQHRAGKPDVAREALEKGWLMVTSALGPGAEDGPPTPHMTLPVWAARARVNILYKEAKQLIGEKK